MFREMYKIVSIGILAALYIAYPINTYGQEIELISPISKLKKWDLIFLWKEVPDATTYTIIYATPEQLKCKRRDGRTPVLRGGGILMEIRKLKPGAPTDWWGFSCTNGICEVRSPNLHHFQRRKPSGDKPNGWCQEGSVNGHSWAIQSDNGAESDVRSFSYEKAEQ